MKVFTAPLFLFLFPFLCLVPLRSPAGAQPGASNPPLLECGRQGEAEIVCGTRAPEDFEPTPDGRFLIVANFGRGEGPGLELFALETGTFAELPLSASRRPGWGDPACTESIGADLGPHGLSLSRRTGGEWQLYVVNHSVRESMEMYELLPDGRRWKLEWRGCVIAREPYNDVAALPDGGFVATRPQSLQGRGQDLFTGGPSGDVAIWRAGEGERALPAAEYGYPNGVLVSADGRHAFVSGWTTRDLHKYDLTMNKEVARSVFEFMPDNLSWTPDGQILAAGIKGVSGNCPPESGNPCLQGFGVAEIDPDTLQTRTVFDNKGRALINGVSVALEAGEWIYIGSFQGDRLVKLPPGPRTGR